MTPPLNFTITDWFALAPRLSTREAWQDWLKQQTPLGTGVEIPVLDFVPAIQRRRLSPLLKMAMYSCYQLHSSGDINCVFASRHGDLHSTDKMLLSLAQGEPVSPTLFSHTVHNAAPGLFSILTGNRAPHTAIAAGTSTFTAGLIEAISKLYAEELEQILFCYYDYLVPDHYQQFLPAQEIPLAIALKLSHADADGITLNCAISPQPSSRENDKAVHFLTWILDDHGQHSITLDSWQFSRQ